MQDETLSYLFKNLLLLPRAKSVNEETLSVFIKCKFLKIINPKRGLSKGFELELIIG